MKQRVRLTLGALLALAAALHLGSLVLGQMDHPPTRRSNLPDNFKNQAYP